MTAWQLAIGLMNGKPEIHLPKARGCCGYCGEPFILENKRQKYCNSNCATRFRNQKKAQIKNAAR
jgi:hypothetical protein